MTAATHGTHDAIAERVLVVSIDGLAPRAISRRTMPRLCALARRGAACFAARTVEPPVTVPAHASMLRGVAPTVHGLVDNARLPAADRTRSFLDVARAAGRSTASVICWLPLDDLVEPDAATHRVTTEGGYDPLDDDRAIADAIALQRGPAPDVTFVYLVACDLAGHAHGWDSAEYAAAVARTDVLVGTLLDAIHDDVAVVVTTDHGGTGRGHGDPVPDTMTTFVAARSARLPAGSLWTEASILDVAPTVADLVGVAPDPSWTGRSLLGAEVPIGDHLMALLASMADHTYGERVDMLSHSLQAAACARRDGADDELVLAALLHDIGHLLGDAGRWGLPDHAEVGARALRPWLPEAVVEPIRLHVAAKRYLVATDPDYASLLSEASVATLAQQGGPFSPDEVAEFEANPHAAAAVALRRWDDAGKTVGLDVRPLAELRALLWSALAE